MRFVFVFLVTTALSGAALAQQQNAPAELADQGRYALERSADGSFLRVDKQTGATTHCRESGGRWTCAAVAEERAALEDEIGRLAAENARLKERIAALEKKPGTEGEGPTLQLPSKEDMGKVWDFFSDMANRAYDFFEGIQRDFERQSG